MKSKNCCGEGISYCNETGERCDNPCNGEPCEERVMMKSDYCECGPEIMTMTHFGNGCPKCGKPMKPYESAALVCEESESILKPEEPAIAVDEDKITMRNGSTIKLVGDRNDKYVGMPTEHKTVANTLHAGRWPIRESEWRKDTWKDLDERFQVRWGAIFEAADYMRELEEAKDYHLKGKIEFQELYLERGEQIKQLEAERDDLADQVRYLSTPETCEVGDPYHKELAALKAENERLKVELGQTQDYRSHLFSENTKLRAREVELVRYVVLVTHPEFVLEHPIKEAEQLIDEFEERKK